MIAHSCRVSRPLTIYQTALSTVQVSRWLVYQGDIRTVCETLGVELVLFHERLLWQFEPQSKQPICTTVSDLKIPREVDADLRIW